jgi:hypothetical protein
MRQFNTDWDNAPCDPEGATEDQDLFMDQLLENASNELLQLLA